MTDIYKNKDYLQKKQMMELLRHSTMYVFSKNNKYFKRVHAGCPKIVLFKDFQESADDFLITAFEF